MLNWSKITPSTFEELVFDYANIQEPNYVWVKTPISNDGNKDIYSQSSQTMFSSEINTQYWLEAKYNENCGTLSKGQLDPTLVSGYLAGNVQVILFVTNGRFTENYLNRAERFYNIPNYRIVHFVDGIELEQWLFRNPDILRKYFNDVKTYPQNIDIHIKYCFFTDIQSFKKGYPIPLQLLNRNSFYILYMRVSIFTTSIYTFSIMSDDIIVIDDGNLFFKEGTHQVYLKVKTINTCKNRNVSILIRKKNDEYKYLLNTKITIYDLFVPTLTHPSQERIIKTLFESLRTYNSGCNMVAIIGSGGSGKSHVLKELEADIPMNYLYNYIQFSTNNNCQKLCSLVMKLCFPGFSYVNRDIYKDILHNKIPSCHLLNKILLGDSDAGIALEIVEEILNYREYENILIENFLSQQQLFFLEDVHKLSQREGLFLKKVLQELSCIGKNITIVITSRPQKEVSPLIYNLITELFNIFELSPIDAENIKISLSSNLNTNVVLDNEIIESLTTSALFLSNYIVKLHDFESVNNNSLKLNIFANRILREENVNIISGLDINRYKPYYNLLDIIFILYDGLEYDFALQIASDSDIMKLNYERVIKICNKRLYPFHDMIRESYLEHRKEKLYRNLGKTITKLILFRNNKTNLELECILLNCGIQHFNSAYENVKNGIYQLINNQNYHAALYLIKILISNKFIDSKYISKYSTQCLYFYYAICLAHSSKTGNAISFFEKAYLLGKYEIENVNSLCLSYAAKAEIINEKFWTLQINNLQNEINNLIENVEEKISFNKFLCNEYFISAYLNVLNRNMVFNYLIDNNKTAHEIFKICEEKCLLLNKPNHLGYAYMDYARANYVENRYDSLDYLQRAKKTFEEKTQEVRRKLIVDCDIAFLRTINERHNISILIQCVNLLKENGYYSEYLKGILRIAACLLIDNKKEYANEFLKYCLQNKQSEDARSCGLLSNLLAAYYLLSKNIEKAVQYTIIQKEYFNNIGNSYKKVIDNNLKYLYSLHPASIPRIDWNFNMQNFNAFYLETRIW